MIASLSISFTGGMISLLTSAYRYITLNTNEETRSLKFVALEIIYIIGLFKSKLNLKIYLQILQLSIIIVQTLRQRKVAR